MKALNPGYLMQSFFWLKLQWTFVTEQLLHVGSDHTGIEQNRHFYGPISLVNCSFTFKIEQMTFMKVSIFGEFDIIYTWVIYG